MKNIDKIKQMTAEELAEYMKCTHCYECVVTKNKCIDIYDGKMTCKDVIRQWLEQESEE